MEESRSRTLDGNSVERGVQASVPGRSTTSYPSKSGGVVSPQGPFEEGSLARRSLHYVNERGNGNGSTTGSRVLQPSLPGGESDGRLETSHRSVGPQQVCVQDRLQDGHPEVSPGVLERRRLHDIHRYQGLLFPDPYSPLQQKVPSGEVGFPDLAIQDSLLRPVNSAPNFHENLHDCLRMGSRTRNSSDSLPGRLVAPFFLRGSFEGARLEATAILQSSGYHHQPGEVAPVSLHQDDVLGDGSRLPTSESLSIRGKAEQPGPGPPSLPIRTAQESEGLAEIDRPSSIIGETGSPREKETQDHPMEPEGTLEPRRFSLRNSSCSSRDKVIPGVVAGPDKHPQGDALRSGAPGDAPLHGRLQGRMGSSPSQEVSKGLLDGGGKDSAYQRPGDEGRSESVPSVRRSSKGKHSGVSVRQRHSGSLHKEARRSKIEGAVRSHGDSGLGRVRTSCNNSKCSTNKDGSQPKDDFGSALVAREGMVRGSKRASVPSPVVSARQTRSPEAATLPKIPRQSPISVPSRVEVIQRLLRKEGYSAGTAERMSRYLRHSSAAIYQAKWTTFTKWCASRNIKPLRASIPDIADFLIHLRDVVGMSISAIKGVHAALGQVFLLKGIDLGSSRHISMLIRSFEQTCPSHASRVPQCDVARVLKMLSEPPFEPLKDIVDRNLTLKTVFLLALASAKRVGEIHGLSYEVSYTRGWREISFKFVPSFVAKTQNPAVVDPKFVGFTVPAIPRSGNPEDLKLCPVRAVRKYLERTASLRPGIKNLFVSTGTFD
ncbi:uncharacterized protein [Palaemon carinicauda]|uniref:uncharacterized protein n=1 Tax=Palaemon carinicauda TaxID=392227 RepID=UPI0035B618B1